MEFIDDMIEKLTMIKQFHETIHETYGTFADIPGLSKYKVSDRGYVQNKKSFKLLYPKVSKDGHIEHLLSDNWGVRRRYPLRFLVAGTFIPSEGRLLNVEHIDGDKTNNEVTNLRRV
jgi:hypothetical protein